eukprot:327281_1
MNNKTMTLNHVNASSPHEETITKKLVNAAYKSYKDEDSDINESQIIHILGGIDMILYEFLRERSDVQITQNQLNRLHQLFITPKQCQSQNKHSVLAKLFSFQNDEQYIDYTTHIFDDSCTYLHQFLGDVLATKIVNILHSTWPHIIFFVMMGIFLVLRLWCSEHIIYSLFMLICSGLATHFYVMIWLLSVNKKGLGLVMQTFEFWFKCAYITIGVVLLLVNQYALNNAWGSMNHKYLRLAGHIATFFNGVLVIIIISMFDALRISRSSKVLFSVTAAIGTTIMCIYSEYMTYFNGNDSMIYVTNSIGLSLLSLQQNAMEIIAIFSWKQAILTIVKRGRCVLIKHSPYIEWKTDSKKTSEDLPDVQEPTVTEEHDTSIGPLNTMRYLPDDRAIPKDVGAGDTLTGVAIRSVKSPGNDNESESNDIPLFFSS